MSSAHVAACPSLGGTSTRDKYSFYDMVLFVYLFYKNIFFLHCFTLASLFIGCGQIGFEVVSNDSDSSPYDTQSDTNSGLSSDVDSGTNTAIVADTSTDLDTNTSSNTDTDTNTNTDTDTDTGTNTDTDTDTGNDIDLWKPRVITMTDLSANTDDEQSIVRHLVSSDQYDIEGLIVTTGCWTQSQSSTAMLDNLVTVYGQVYPNLTIHSDGFPLPEYLASITVMGQTGYSMGDVGAGKDSEGSELIIAAVDRNDPRPIWFGCWGGCNTLAQAFWKVENTRSAAELALFVSKVRVFDIEGQDDTGAWMTHNFPDLFFIRAVGIDGWAPSANWIDTNVQNHGPLGAAYPDTKAVTEGDSTAFLHLYPAGLHDPQKITQGGWGGRFEPTKQCGIRGMPPVTEESQHDTYCMYPVSAEGGSAISRWGAGLHNDFEARMDWTTTSIYNDANHHPIAVANGDTGKSVLELTTSANFNVELTAAGSNDPDGDELSYSWYFYNEPSSYSGSVPIQNNTSVSATVAVPTDATGKSIHVILEINDNGTPNLYAYRRVIISVN